jgi:hypothetical protein
MEGAGAVADAVAEFPRLNRVLVATDRSDTADKAVRWAASMVGAFQADLRRRPT